MIVVTCQGFGYSRLCMPEIYSWSHLIEYSNRMKESETFVDLGDDDDLKASHEAMASELAEEDGSLN